MIPSWLQCSAGGRKFSTRWAKYHKKRHLCKFSQKLAPHTTYNIFFWFLKFLGSKNNFYTLFKKCIKKVDMCFFLDWEKRLPININKLFSLKNLRFKSLTVKSLHHKRYQRYVFSLHSLHKIHWRCFLDLFHQFFSLCIKGGIQW